MASVTVNARETHPFPPHPGRKTRADGSEIERIATELKQIVDCRLSGRGVTVFRYHGEEYQFINRREIGYLARLLKTRSSIVIAASTWLASQQKGAVEMSGE